MAVLSLVWLGVSWLCPNPIPSPNPIPNPYQVPLALAGCDLMCCAQTGSGKTAAFLVPIVTSLASDERGSTVGTRGAARPRAVVMAPTRELVIQIELEAQKLTNRSALRPVAVYGGADQRAQANPKLTLPLTLT